MTTSLLGLRDRALIALMGYTFARAGAVTGMKVEDFTFKRPQLDAAAREGRQGDGASLSSQPGPISGGVDCGLGSEPEPLFPTLRHDRLTDRTCLPQANVHM